MPFPLDVEKCYSEAIERETERIRYQQKMLLLYKRQMRSQEMKILGLMHKSTGQEDLNSRMEDLDSLMNRIESNVSSLSLIANFSFNLYFPNIFSALAARNEYALCRGQSER